MPDSRGSSEFKRRERLRVASHIHLPGGYPDRNETLTPKASNELSLAQAVHARRAEYTRSQSLRVKVGTWNVAAFKDTDKDLGKWFVQGRGLSERLNGVTLSGAPETSDTPVNADQNAKNERADTGSQGDDPVHVLRDEHIGIYVLGLQEIVDINSAREALRPFTDDTSAKNFKRAMEQALPKGYQLVVEQQLIGLYLIIYASSEILPEIHSVSTTSVGTGLMGYMGNKGAVTARLVVGETTKLVFINSHFGAGTGKAELDRRNWDVAQVASRTRFDPITDGLGVVQQQGERIGDEDYAFWFGDLNYRIEGVPPEDVRKLLMLHTRNEYDLSRDSQSKINEEFSQNSSPSNSSTGNGGNEEHQFSSSSAKSMDHSSEDSNDPASLMSTLTSLLRHDELRQAQASGKAFHDGWREGEITFLPTYKYDVGTVGVFDSGEKKRGPSWCDRILFRSKRDRLMYEDEVHGKKEAQKRDAEMRSAGIDTAATDEDTMFEYDPDADGDDDYDYDENTTTDRSHQDAQGTSNIDEDLLLECYTSHQRILSADHKPLEAVFQLKYDAAVRELRSKVQAEVARELDRAENEGRPVITLVVDGGIHSSKDSDFSGINFGHVHYDDAKTSTLTLANTGRVPAVFGFVSHPQHSDQTSGVGISPKWLSINFDKPSIGTSKSKPEDDMWDHDIDKVFKLEPGETTNVEVVSLVKDKAVLRNFNDCETMEDILVLRVKDGRDHFIPVRGEARRSVYGRKLDQLMRIPEGGVRLLQRQKPDDTRDREHSAEQPPKVIWSAPREIFRLTQAIENLIERVMAESSMIFSEENTGKRPPWFASAGWPFVEESLTLDAGTRSTLRFEVNEALDTGRPLDAMILAELTALERLEIFADVFLDFIRSLEDGIIVSELWSSIEDNLFPKKAKAKPSVDNIKSTVLELMSEDSVHRTSFILITSMVERVAQEIGRSFLDPPTPVSQSPIRSRSSTVSSISLPASPRVTVKRGGLNHDPMVASKQLSDKNIAAVFADVLIRVASDRSLAGTESHRRTIIEAFVSSEMS